MPISSKRIELGGAPSTGVRQIYIPDTIQNSSRNNRMEWEL